jgi:hypothetical protein
VDEKSTVWYDNLDRNNFNMDTVDCMISWLGYEKRKFIFWCPPGKAIDELTEVVFERDCKLMAEASVDSKVLVWFIHHPSEEEQQVKDEISRGENSEDSDQEEAQEEQEGLQQHGQQEDLEKNHKKNKKKKSLSQHNELQDMSHEDLLLLLTECHFVKQLNVLPCR